MRNLSVNPSEIQSSSKSNLTINQSRNYKNSKSTSEFAKKSCNTNTSVNLIQNVSNKSAQNICVTDPNIIGNYHTLKRETISSSKLDLAKNEMKNKLRNRDVVQFPRYVSPNFNKDHKCNDCNRHFTTRKKLNIHQKQHKQTKILEKVKCKWCSITITKCNLLRHIKNLHPNINPIKCNNCPIGFKDRTSLMLHKSTCHYI